MYAVICALAFAVVLGIALAVGNSVVKYFKNRRIISTILCAISGGMVGFFANHLSELYGCVLFGVGIALMIFSIFKLSK